MAGYVMKLAVNTRSVEPGVRYIGHLEQAYGLLLHSSDEIRVGWAAQREVMQRLFYSCVGRFPRFDWDAFPWIETSD